jgi:hypothetical protein
MVLLRRVAVRVSKFVVRHASTGSHEWAEGLAREVEFIENDWRALAWALGSTRVLLERRSSAAQRERRPWPTVGDYALCYFLTKAALGYAIQAGTAMTWQGRVGLTVVALGWAWCAISRVRDWLQKRNAPPESDVPAWRAHSRARLQEELTRSHSLRRWLTALLPAAMCGGYMLATPKWWYGYAAFLAWLTIAVLRRTPAKIQSRIEIFDAATRLAEARFREATVLPVQGEYIRTESFPNLFRRRRLCRRRALR